MVVQLLFGDIFDTYQNSDHKTYFSHTLFVIDRATKRANTQETSIMRHGE